MIGWGLITPQLGGLVRAAPALLDLWSGRRWRMFRLERAKGHRDLAQLRFINSPITR